MRHDRDVPSLSCYCGFNLRREAAPHATQQEALQDGGEPVSFNLRREAAPHATTLGGSWYCPLCRFQSQTRSRSTCDDRAYPGSDRAFPCFNLRREAAPHATEGRPLRIGLPCEVSISDEKPLHMRRWSPYASPGCTNIVSISDEKPLHMRHVGILPDSSYNVGVSISDEKPLHMRRPYCCR